MVALEASKARFKLALLILQKIARMKMMMMISFKKKKKKKKKKKAFF